MNERVRELAKQACITIVPEPFDDASRSWNDTMEKFAELIVRECIDTVLDSSVEYTTRPRIAEELKEHFGVENA